MTDDLQQVLDRLAVSDVLHRYGSALDEKDWPTLLSCFTPDCRALYAGQTQWLTSGAEIVDWIRAMTATTPWQHHFLSVQLLEITGDGATSVTYLVSSQHTDEQPPGLVRMLGTYHDVHLRTSDGWRIAERRLELGWAERQGTSP